MEHNNIIFLKVPTLRLRGYSEKWNKKSFAEVFEFLSNNTLSRAELNYEGGNYKNIHYGDVLIKFPAFISVTDTEVPFVSTDSEAVISDKSLLQNGDIIIADTAEDYTVGKATEVEDVDLIKTVSGLHTIACRPQMQFASRFLGYYINSPAYHNQLIPFIQGVKVSSVSKSLIKNTKISYPSLNEQQRLAALLSLIDARIKVQSKIIEDLKVLKKELCSKCFCGGNLVRLGDFSIRYLQCS